MNNFRLIIRKNIPKLRNLLNNLGYHYNSSRDRIHSDGYIYVTDFKYYIVFDTPTNCIDCGEDEQIFIKYLYKHTECYIREHNKTELTINQKRLLEKCINDGLNSDNNNLPVEIEDNKNANITNGVIYDHSELDEVVTYPFYKRPDLPVTFCNMIGRKCGNFTTKHQPDKKSKKSARRNNRRAKRNNR